MFIYDKKLQYPVKVAKPNPRLASIIISQYGGPDGELGASLRYLSQRYSMPFDELKGLLTDIGVEELGHLEMIGALVHQLTRNMKDDQYRDPTFAPYFVDHTAGVYPTAASGFPYSAAQMQVKGDPIADLAEDLGADAATAQSQRRGAGQEKKTRCNLQDDYTVTCLCNYLIAYFIYSYRLNDPMKWDFTLT
jgi:spore coat protein JC